MYIKYFADDGTEFESEKECIEYEVKVYPATFNYAGEKNVPYSLESACFVKIENVEQAFRFWSAVATDPYINEYFQKEIDEVLNHEDRDEILLRSYLGWWYYDEFNEDYKYVDDKLVKLIKEN